MKKKKILIPIAIVFSLAIISVIIFLVSKYDIFTMKTKDGYSKSITILNENYPSDIIVYGEHIDFGELKHREIKFIDGKSLNSKPEYKYQFVIINDRNNNVEMTDDELLLIKQYIIEKKYNFYYLGTALLPKLKELGIGKDLITPNVQGVAVVNKYGNEIVTLDGVWTAESESCFKQNPKILANVLAFSFTGVIESNN